MEKIVYILIVIGIVGSVLLGYYSVLLREEITNQVYCTGADCIFNQSNGIGNLNIELVCFQDSDCACGSHIETDGCFFGNRNFVNTSVQCPDYCTGIGGNLMISCVQWQCVQGSSLVQ